MRIYRRRKAGMHTPSSAFDNVPGVYAIVQTSTERAYVGATRHLAQRVAEHVSQLRSGKHPCASLQSAWDETGEADFVFKCLEVLPDTENIRAHEQRWIMATTLRFNTNHALPPEPPPPAVPVFFEMPDRAMPDMTGHEIRALRKSWNMSQQEFASLWGVSYRFLWGVEKENKTPDRVYQLALETIMRQRHQPPAPDPPLAYAV